MIILGIETSCDETGVAIVENGTKILSNIVASSASLHAKTGGVIPENAARQQIKSIIPVLQESLKESHLTQKDIDTIAVTVGPGLIGSLLVGVETARTLSLLWNKPIIPVNHLVAHIYANFVGNIKLPEFPAICLVISGGHTDLVLMENHKDLTYLGGTRDDASGEAFDKTARLLGLPYPGGPNLSKEAEKFLSKNPNYKLNLFPRPMINEDNLDFSFSGLKTAVLKEVQNNKIISKEELAAQVQEAIVDVLIFKTLKAVKKYKPRSLFLAGGVSANSRLREKFISEIDKEIIEVDLMFPAPKFCTDNAAAIASCAYFNYSSIPWQKIEANPELTIMGKI